MNSKELKVEKKLKRSKSNLKNAGQQIFVLPPNLLQKLGINLENVGGTPNSTHMGHKISNCDSNHSSTDIEDQINSNFNNETSITKTASLMKESVFLSPTFNDTNLNNVASTNIGGYVEICNGEINYTPEKHKKVFSSSNINFECDNSNNKNIEDNYNGSANHEGFSRENNIIQIKDTTLSEKVALQNETKPVINIISEETVTVEKLSELKVLQIPPKNTMIPASLNTIIRKNAKKSSIEQSQALPSLREDIADNTNLQHCNSNEAVINEKIERSKTENIVNDNSKINYNTENKDIHENNVQKVNSLKPNICESFNNNSDKIRLKDRSMENVHFNLRQTTLSIIDNVSSSESRLTDKNIFEDIKPSPYYHKQFTNSDNNNTLLNDDNNVVQIINNTKLEPMKIDHIDIINTNNNTWDHNKSDVSINEILILKDTTGLNNNQQKNIKANSLQNENCPNVEECKLGFMNIQKEKTCIVNNSDMDPSSICETYKTIFIDEQERPFEISNDNVVSSIQVSKSITKQSSSGIIHDEGMNKLSLPSNPNRNNLMSKLCIQGVEKPGGIIIDMQNKVSLKTYSNKDKIHGKTVYPKETLINIPFDYNSDIDLKETGILNSLPPQEFCKCCDYGILDHNKFENSYEHIHFTRRTPLDCPLDTIYGIYDIDVMNIGDTRINLDHFQENIDQIDSEYSENYICWCNADTLANKFDTGFNNSQKQEEMLNEISHVALKDESVMKINQNNSNNHNVDYKIEASTLNNVSQAKTCKDSLPYLNMEAKLNAAKKCFSKKYGNESDFQNHSKNNSYSMDLEKLSRKRKMSMDCDSMSKNKKAKNVNYDADGTEKLPETKRKNSLSFKDSKEQEENILSVANDQGHVKCAVCGIIVINAEWSTHIASVHDYIAWKEGEPPVNLKDEDALRDHLHQVTQELGQLKCSNCGLIRKYAKSFLHHLKSCYSSSDIHNDTQIPYHLSKILEDSTARNCDHCDHICKNAKDYAIHVKTCSRQSGLYSRKSIEKTPIEDLANITCGVCKEEVSSSQWITHIQQEHSYQAWREGDTPLNFQDEESIKKHLYKILQEYGPLVCSKCGKSRKYVKLFLQHIGTCTGPKEEESVLDISTAEWESVLDTSLDDVDSTKVVKCGRCHLEMESKQWINHIQKEHNYISWPEGMTPLDILDEELVRRYLYVVVHKLGTLVCTKCGISRKYVKSFLSHIENCMGSSESDAKGSNNTSVSASQSIGINHSMNVHTSSPQVDAVTSPPLTTDSQVQPITTVKCGVCQKEMNDSNWITHIAIKHEYVAWKDTETAIDLSSYEAIIEHLTNIIEKTGALKCADCGKKFKQAKGFLLHIKSCYGKTYVEIDDENITSVDSVSDMEASLDTTLEATYVLEEEETTPVRCGVCAEEMQARLWIDHIHKQHNYLAWRDGQPALDLENKELIRSHLKTIVLKIGRLTCAKCGLRRRKIIPFYDHITACEGIVESTAGTFEMLTPKKESKENVTCALCRLDMDESKWMEHISKEHNYVSWKLNERPLVFKDETSLRDHLHNIVQSIGSLKCNECGLERKYAKSYLLHIEMCQSVTWLSINESITKIKKEEGDMVRCGVCGAEMDDTEWIEHIRQQHSYFAWRDCEPALNLDDEDEVRNHLKNIIQQEGYLKCPKCNLRRKYAKLYLNHVNTCDGIQEDNGEFNDSRNGSVLPSDDGELDGPGGSVVKCGVCALQVEKSTWLLHIQKEHKYLAWKEGTEPIDLNNKEAVYSHLSAINVICNGLTCSLCGVVRKYVKSYMQHVEDCKERNYVDSNEVVECGVCGEKLLGKFWKSHAMQSHYNIAWVVGDTPIDVRNSFSIDKCLKEYQEYNHKLVCNLCGLSRVSLAGFYAHILICGKTEEEIESWKDVCHICNQKYLFIYKTQHLSAHRAQEMAKERKMKEILKKEEDSKEIDTNQTPGRRRAAEKARSVIGDYAAKLADYKCKSCTFETDSKEDLASHRCHKRAANLNEDSDDSVSIKLEDYSEEETEDTDVESDLSNEEEETTLKMKIKNGTTTSKLTTKSSKFPFEVKEVKPYLQESRKNYFELFHTRETLFTHWRDCTYETVTDDFLPQYMPELEESCKLSISNGSWTTYKRFESREENGCTVLFTGGSIQCIAWAPEHPDSTLESHSLLAVATHRGPDCPRLQITDTLRHPALVQIWDFGTFKSTPKMVFGLAHDYGTVWAMDWCPSGARDISDTESDAHARPRLGLLVMACSNGSAYVVSVPYPDKTRASDITFYKVKPCVELKLNRGSNKYQSTSVNWSMFKGYTTISVGYGDGTVALYDLVTESPLLTAKDGDINILYPFQDERVHNSSVTGLTSSVLGAWCSSSPTGSTAGVAEAAPRAGRGAHPVRTHSVLAASSAMFMPHWPNVMLSGDDTIVGLSPSELEWGYVGRRVGSVRALAACVHRARLVAMVPPLLQVMRAHPAAFKGHKTINKKNVAMLEMAPLTRKRSKVSNDQLSMKVEPITYEEAIASYGIEFKFETELDKRTQQKQRVPFPERFPLADVPALAYCPAAARHTKLALATHSGLLLLLDV